MQEAFDLELMVTQLLTQLVAQLVTRLHDWRRNTPLPSGWLVAQETDEPAGNHVLTFPSKEAFRPDFLAPRQPSDHMTMLLSGCGKGPFCADEKSVSLGCTSVASVSGLCLLSIW